MWQAFRDELHPKGFELVSVGLETLGAEACRPFVEAAAPAHPSLVDVGHVLAERFGVVNIPNAVWIDEDGVIVRPAEPAFPPGRPARPAVDAAALPGRIREIFAEASKLSVDAESYADALRDWVEHGRASRYALSPEQVMERSARRDLPAAEAAAHFALAQHLWRAGRTDAAVGHFRESHRLQPENIAYKRQAWSLASPVGGPFDRFWQGPVEGREAEWPYDSDWLTEFRELGPQRYYPPLEL